MIDPDAKAAVSPELMPGERLLWAGKPGPLTGFWLWSRWVSCTIGGVVLMMLLPASLSMLWEAARSGPLSLAVGLAIFALLGALPTLVMFSVWRMQAMDRSESYALTDKRLLIHEAAWPEQVWSLPREALIWADFSAASPPGTLTVTARTARTSAGAGRILSTRGYRLPVFDAAGRDRVFYLHRLPDAACALPAIRAAVSNTPPSLHGATP